VKFVQQTFFSIWYFLNPPWDTGLSPPELLRFIDSHPPGVALDLGCGTGTNAITLAEFGWDVVGIDFAPPAIRTARKKAKRAGVEVDFRTGDVVRPPGVSGPFDLVLDIGCFHNLNDLGKKNYVSNLERLLGPNGTFLMYGMLRKDEATKGPGIRSQDIDLLNSNFLFEERQDGTERGKKPSVWLTFRRAKLDDMLL
jgi:SAM-dependent methyltransferase